MLITAATLTTALAIGVASPFAPPILHSLPVQPKPQLGQHAERPRDDRPVIILTDELATTLPGVTRPERNATLSVPFDGIIAELPVREGTRVRKGEIIAVLDDRVARQAVRVSETDASHDASVVRARAVLSRAADALRRAETAYAAGAMNDEQIEEARHRRDIADADLRFAEEVFDKAQAQLALTRAEQEEHRIRAPFDGVIVRVYAEPGEVMSPGELLADIIDLDTALVDLYLPAERALSLRQGDRVALALAEPINAVVTARVRYAEPRVDPTSRATRVVFEIAPAWFSIPAGVLVTPAGRAPSGADSDRLTALSEKAGAIRSAFATEQPGEVHEPAVAIVE